MIATISQADRTTRPSRPRSRAGVVVFVLLGLVQLFVSAVVPLGEGRAPTQLGAHIEQQSERLHYVHNEANCAACVARHLTSTAPVSDPLAPHASRFAAQPPAAPLLQPNAERRDPTVARAPPVLSRLG
jgi:hypothetical protein